MRKSRSWLVPATVAVAVACNAVLGLEDTTLVPGSASHGGQGAGTAGTTDGGDQGGGAGGEGHGGSDDGGSGGAEGGGSGTAGDDGGSPCNPRCSATQTCVSGACENHECAPSQRFCSGSSVRKCADDGLSSVEVATCASGQYCDASSTTCQTGVCAPNAPACDGDRATTCESNGSGYLPGGTVCGADATCESGACRPHLCPPGERFCLGQDVKHCAPDGLSSSVESTCQAAQYCDPNTTACGSLVTAVAGSLDGFTSTFPCSAPSGSTYQCANTGCTNGSLRVEQSFPIGGTPGAIYEIFIRVRGVVEGKLYDGQCARRASSHDTSAEGGDFLCVGGGTLPSTYAIYSLEVLPAVSGQPGFFGLNSRVPGTGEAQETFALDYAFTLRAAGGSSIRYVMFDSNCIEIRNCGPGVASASCFPRVLTFAPDTSPMPALEQPNLGSTWPGEWISFDVVSVTAL